MVDLARMLVSMLSCPVAKCWMMTKTKPVFGGNVSSNDVIASKPPAEAPIPTIGTTLPWMNGDFSLDCLVVSFGFLEITFLSPQNQNVLC